MSREQFFKPNNQKEPKIKEPVIPEKLADWEIVKAQHLAEKEVFHESRRLARLTGKEKYIEHMFGKHIKYPDKPSM